MKRLVAAAALLAACQSRATGPVRQGAHWVVVAPHPDDEALIAAGVVRHAIEAGDAVDVIVVTNGDFDCVHDGLLREGESLAGLHALGLGPEHVHFLGYPDGSLARLGEEPLSAKRLIEGRCVMGEMTYGRGVEPHFYTRPDAIADLAQILGELRPSDIATTHPEDTHPDHATTYSLVRAALDSLELAPTVHRALIHNGDCWPTGTAPHEPCPLAPIAPTASLPPLTGRLAGYVAPERIPVPASCLVKDPAVNPKLLAIAAHASQTRGTLESYLFAFAKREELFFPEPSRRRAETIAREARPGDRLMRDGYVVTIGRDRATLAQPPREWLLPHDMWEDDDEEPFTLSVAPGEGVTEITLRVRGSIAGAAVDVSASPSARHAL